MISTKFRAKRKRKWEHRNQRGGSSDRRLKVLKFAACFGVVAIILRLFMVQVLDNSFYEVLASGQHQIYRDLFPERGEIYMQGFTDELDYRVAANQYLTLVWADTRRIEDPNSTAEAITDVFEYEEEDLYNLIAKLSREDDPYEPIEHKVDDETVVILEALELEGINFTDERFRFYPEEGIGGHVLGFVGSDADGQYAGRYGIEGYFDEELSGSQGFIRSERDAAGRLITIGERSFEPAIDGSNIHLTIDRTIQFTVCQKLYDAVLRHGADGGSVVIIEPSTGAIIAMCGAPDFDPAAYNEVETIDVYNNPVIFDAYEPGSIFKPFTMAAALDQEKVSPTTTYEDTGEVVIGQHTIRNSDLKSNGVQTMTEVLEKSLNTGVIFAMREVGEDTFRDYMVDFGFGEIAGIELDTEVAADISSLEIGSEIYAATASFGQGITVTPLQLVAAYAAIANEGVLVEPYIVREIEYADGTTKKTMPQEIRQVISSRAAKLLSAMLVSVVENGHGSRAGVEGYYIAGKTGTAQVPKKDGLGYDPDQHIGSFAGFGPVNDPQFAMIVRVNNPRDVQWAESSAAPLFGEIAEFLLQYYQVPTER